MALTFKVTFEPVTTTWLNGCTTICGAAEPKLAVMTVFEVRVRVKGLIEPVAPPLQPRKGSPGSGVAVTVMVEPMG